MASKGSVKSRVVKIKAKIQYKQVKVKSPCQVASLLNSKARQARPHKVKV